MYILKKFQIELHLGSDQPSNANVKLSFESNIVFNCELINEISSISNFSDKYLREGGSYAGLNCFKSSIKNGFSTTFHGIPQQMKANNNDLLIEFFL